MLQKYILLEDIDGAGHKATHRKFFVLSLYIKTKNHPFPFRLSRLKYFVEVKWIKKCLKAVMLPCNYGFGP